MAKVKAEQPLLPSLLDRLLDDEPDVSREAPRRRQQVLREMKESVRRDLQDLLNTRARCRPWPANLKELERSLLSYGLPDFIGANLSLARAREELPRLLETIIRQHEPRFKTVKVQLMDSAEPLDRTLRFRIDALLNVEPAPEPVIFDSVLRAVTGTFEVRGEDG
jgi:type VI secretion system protein ImpF